MKQSNFQAAGGKRQGANQHSDAKGFTIIEVVLVLAIAGLIFLVVFLALPQLQQSRRDTQRRSDLARVVAAFDTYRGNNNGDLPGEGIDTRIRSYLPDTLNDPSTNVPYVDDMEGIDTVSEGAFSETAVPGKIFYFPGGSCDGDSLADGDGTISYGIAIKLENGQYCLSA